MLDAIGSSTSLANVTRLTQQLAILDDVADIKDIRDKAEAVRQYAKSAALGLEVQNNAAEIKLRAERRAGNVLCTMRLRGGDRKSAGRGKSTSLTDLGITQNQSTRWQKMSKLPAADFDAYLLVQRSNNKEILSSDIIRLANDAIGRPASADPDRDRYTVISEIENHRRLLEEILKPNLPYGPVELSSGEARHVQRLLREMCSLLQDLQKMDASDDSSNPMQSKTPHS